MMKIAETSRANLASWFLRVGLAFSFIYSAMAALINPIAWSGFVPAWVVNIIPAGKFLAVFSLLEIALAFWLIFGRKIYAASLIAASVIFAVIIVNLGAFEITFRDVGLGLAGLALADLSKRSG